jgi:ABC-type multidrug transport system ATPase subunit
VRPITTIKLALTFYKNFLVASFLITLLCCLLFLEYGGAILLPLHWLKLSATAVIFFYIRTYKNKEFYYYQNFGLSKTFLWSTTISLDLILYVLLLLGTKTFAMHHLTANSIQLTLAHRPILTDIHLHCRTGAITGLLGRNGAGKSCLLQILYGTLPAASRSVKFDNQPVSKPCQHPDLVRFLPQFNFIPKTLSPHRILDDFELASEDFENQFPEFNKTGMRRPIGQLSGGQRRLVELYVIICSTSQFALLDEPFTHLMPLQIEKIKELLLEYRSKKAFLITDHLYRDVVSVSNELYFLSGGATQHFDNPAQLLANLRGIEKFDYFPPNRN